MSFTPVSQLEVWRTLANAEQLLVGRLAQNAQGVYFQYEQDYLKRSDNLSPFALEFTDRLQKAPSAPHQGLAGVFADSLPDGWGNLLMDRVFRQKGLLPAQVTAMDRLAFVGDRGMGALSYRPASDFYPGSHPSINLFELGEQARSLFEGQTQEVLSALVAAGSSGGARPKAQIYAAPGQLDACRTEPLPGDEAWLVKFTSDHLPLGHEEGLCEAAWLTLAARVGLQVPQWQLLRHSEKGQERQWLALKRFDWVTGTTQANAGRLHMHTACGLLDADFRTPSLDYEDLIKATSLICKSPAAGQLQFKRAVFNLFACNQDDHSKNWAFLQDDQGRWSPAPFYDVTFSPHPYGEQATAFAGYGKNPPVSALQQLAKAASFANWKAAQKVMDQVIEPLADFAHIARDLGIRKETTALIEKQLNDIWQDNKALLNGGSAHPASTRC